MPTNPTDCDRRFVRQFREISLNDRPTVGGKGASLGELTQAGVNVPPGFVVTTAAFERFIAALDADGSIREVIVGLDPGDLPAISAATAKVRARLETVSLPDDLRDTISTAYSGLAGDERRAPVAVRSSATSEDSAEASFAGLQDTYLWVRGAEAVLHCVRSCWASLYSTESVSYRLRLKLPEQSVAMGVVVQRMVESVCSGVMFTRSPTTGDRSVIAIEGSWGLGSCIVSGEVTPDKFVVSKVTRDISKRTLSEKLVQHVPRTESGGVRVEAVPAEKQRVPCLADEEIVALADIGKRVERHYGAPQDIEWAVGQGQAGGAGLYILQSRPETVWASREAQPVAAPKARPFDHVLALLGGRDR
ncbi:MAG: ppsA 3 [Gammaproteobacteria bacterium]|nr:ppsA 3 [Gammaproteobacteria bacterium]